MRYLLIRLYEEADAVTRAAHRDVASAGCLADDLGGPFIRRLVELVKNDANEEYGWV
jgi:hypothetical protein